MTASSVASVKVEREQLEQLARALRVEQRVSESGNGLFRRCLERAVELSPVVESVDRELERVETRARARALVIEVETDNAGALEALGTFRRALGGLGEADATEEAERPPASPRSN